MYGGYIGTYLLGKTTLSPSSSLILQYSTVPTVHGYILALEAAWQEPLSLLPWV
jgi:hypothetical protein